MLRKLLLPALAIALFATAEAAQAQTAPAAATEASTTAQLPAPARQAYRKARKAERVLSKREKQALAAQARADQARREADAAVAIAKTAGSGWGEPLPATSSTGYNAATNRPSLNVSSAPGMPLNQIGHGVTTDYDGRPIRRAEPATTLPTGR